MQTLADVLARADRLDETIMTSFEASIGETVTVQLTSGEQRILIESVSPTKVAGLLQIGVADVVAGRPTSFVFDDLSTREKLLRMGEDHDPAVALGKGLMALEAKAYPHAQRYFKCAPPLVVDALLTELAEIMAAASATDTGP
jgi:hypothetical protein